MADPPTAFYTIGHSTRSLEAFLALLEVAGVERLVDVRTVPRSRRNPQYNPENLSPALAAHGLDWAHEPALGGLRGRSREVDPTVNGWWENRSFHNYADWALTPEFAQALEHLIQRGRERPLAVMCAEALWWRCHRRIIADHLLARGLAVFHLMGKNEVLPAQLTPAARVQGVQVSYPVPAAGD